MILEAALRVLERSGLESMSVQALAEESGASVGSIYHHFGSIGGVLGALYVEGLASFRVTLLEVLSRTEGAQAKVEATVVTFLSWCEANPTWAGFLLRGRGHPGVRAVEAEIRETTREFARELATHFRPHVKAGEIEQLPGELYGPLLTGAAEELVRQWLGGRSEHRPSDHAALLARLIWKSLRGPSSTSGEEPT